MDGPKVLRMPPGAPEVAVQIFNACTELDPGARPSASRVVEMLRGAEDLSC